MTDNAQPTTEALAEALARSGRSLPRGMAWYRDEAGTLVTGYLLSPAEVYRLLPSAESAANVRALTEAAHLAYDRWTHYFDADNRADYWNGLCLAMDKLGAALHPERAAALDADAPAEPRTAGTLAEDIAAMLHYRGRVLHPRSHPKTHGGPCDECAEAGRQAAEFAGSPPTILIRDCEATDHYAASEPRSAEPEGLDAETLARALVNVRPYGGNPGAWALPVARAILAEYARLRGEQR